MFFIFKETEELQHILLRKFETVSFYQIYITPYELQGNSSVICRCSDSEATQNGFTFKWVIKKKKNPPVNTGDRDMGSNPGSGQFPGGGNGNPLQYSCLGYSMNRGAWRATVHRDAKSWTRLKWLSMHVHRLTLSGKSLNLSQPHAFM